MCVNDDVVHITYDQGLGHPMRPVGKWNLLGLNGKVRIVDKLQVMLLPLGGILAVAMDTIGDTCSTGGASCCQLLQFHS